MQGTPGSKFLPEIARALEQAMRENPGRVFVAFKAMHESVDSFGALPYAEKAEFPRGENRVSMTYDKLDGANPLASDSGPCMLNVRGH